MNRFLLLILWKILSSSKSKNAKFQKNKLLFTCKTIRQNSFIVKEKINF